MFEAVNFMFFRRSAKPVRKHPSSQLLEQVYSNPPNKISAVRAELAAKYSPFTQYCWCYCRKY